MKGDKEHKISVGLVRLAVLRSTPVLALANIVMVAYLFVKSAGWSYWYLGFVTKRFHFLETQPPSTPPQLHPSSFSSIPKASQKHEINLFPQLGLASFQQ